MCHFRPRCEEKQYTLYDSKIGQPTSGVCHPRLRLGWHFTRDMDCPRFCLRRCVIYYIPVHVGIKLHSIIFFFMVNLAKTNKMIAYKYKITFQIYKVDTIEIGTQYITNQGGKELAHPESTICNTGLKSIIPMSDHCKLTRKNNLRLQFLVT